MKKKDVKLDDLKDFHIRNRPKIADSYCEDSGIVNKTHTDLTKDFRFSISKGDIKMHLDQKQAAFVMEKIKDYLDL